VNENIKVPGDLRIMLELEIESFPGLRAGESALLKADESHMNP